MKRTAAGSPVTAAGYDTPATREVEGELLLFATATCPNCRQAESLLDKAGIPYTKVMAEEHPELTTRYGVRQAPTLVVAGAGEPVKVVGLGPVKKFIQDNRPANVG